MFEPRMTLVDGLDGKIEEKLEVSGLEEVARTRDGLSCLD